MSQLIKRHINIFEENNNEWVWSMRDFFFNFRASYILPDTHPIIQNNFSDIVNYQLSFCYSGNRFCNHKKDNSIQNEWPL